MKSMKNQLISALLILTTVFWLSGCNDDSEDDVTPAPDISITSPQDITDNEFTGYSGDTLTLNVTINAAGGFNNVQFLENGVNDTTISRSAGNTQTSFSTTYDYVLGDVGDVTLSILATDDLNQSSNELIDITIEAKPTNFYTAKLLYAPAGDATTATFFSTNDGMTYSKLDVEGTTTNVSSKIDFGYYYGTTDKASLASPKEYPSVIYDLTAWTVKNATKLKMTNLSVNDFSSHLNDTEYINKAFDDGTAGDNDGLITELANGNILAFELDAAKGNKRGLIRILDIEAGNDPDDFIEIEVVTVK
ncbi:MAG: hypothetical protein HC819_14165 [Cyclobacteriaceae bacterium]|nr:hypothetical protein [Cyclobacteriaceae bacterium]